MSDEKVLTKEIAEQLVDGEPYGTDIKASGYAQVETLAASFIGRCGGGRGNVCDLSDLVTLNAQCARSLSSFGGSLILSSLAEISGDVALVLASQGSKVDLQYRGVEVESWSNITEDQGHLALLKHVVQCANEIEKPVVLPEVLRVPTKAARVLGKSRSLTLGVESLDGKAAKALAKVLFLTLPRLELTHGVAKEWATGSRVLRLGRYIELDRETAALLPHLIGGMGNLTLSSLECLGPDVAEVLGETKSLTLSKLTAISEGEVAALMCHATSSHKLELPSLSQIDESVALKLSSYPGSLYLRLALLPEAAADILREKARPIRGSS